ncbi:hypothetical protein CGRA01v4_00264 [Colletotrichum graminicola]|nr:hypothetical protein CGRA01v4_00264 [Colletotrichum graminicola]
MYLNALSQFIAASSALAPWQGWKLIARSAIVVC